MREASSSGCLKSTTCTRILVPVVRVPCARGREQRGVPWTLCPDSRRGSLGRWPVHRQTSLAHGSDRPSQGLGGAGSKDMQMCACALSILQYTFEDSRARVLDKARLDSRTEWISTALTKRTRMKEPPPPRPARGQPR